MYSHLLRNLLIFRYFKSFEQNDIQMSLNELIKFYLKIIGNLTYNFKNISTLLY